MNHSADTWEVSLLSGISATSEREWDYCACPEGAEDGRAIDPFSRHRFLLALEQSRSVATSTGWTPLHLVARHGGEVNAVMPLYAKTHSQGEYVFDYGWADAFMRAGGTYYPKLQASIPFTPVTGRRFLTRQGMESDGIETLAEAAKQLAINHNLSSLHVTFCDPSEASMVGEMGFLHRVGEQFHWLNEGYQEFDDFLAQLSSRKRRNIRKERRRAMQFGGRILMLTGDEIRTEHWDAFWIFYQDTGARKWGIPYLKREFFDIIHHTMRDDILLILCERDGQYIAGALNFIGRDCLFGRYWGCTEQHSCLHFEVCYYRAIEFAIAEGLCRVEAGAQGEHKIARGYMPVVTHSLHWIANPAFRRAVSEFVREEHLHVQHDISALTAAGPFKKQEKSPYHD